jgi:hypothetical protein
MNPVMLDWSIFMAIGLAFVFAIAAIQEGLLLIRKWRLNDNRHHHNHCLDRGQLQHSGNAECRDNQGRGS